MSKIETALVDLSVDSEIKITKAAEALKKGELVVFPTETVYGIGANALNEQAVKNIFTAKGRPQDNPLIVHVAELAQVYDLVKSFPAKAELLAKNFWPGPLTIILPKSELVSKTVSGGLDTVAVRIPSNAVARELLKKAGIPVAAPSANLSGTPSATTAQHCYNDLNGKVHMILDGGESEVGLESTVISLVDEIPMLFRPGGVTLEELKEVLGEVRVSDAVLSQISATETAPSPGMKYKHYAPKAKVVLLKGTSKQFTDYCSQINEPETWAMCFKEELKSVKIPAVSYGSENDQDEQGHKLFAMLRELDKNPDITTVLVHAPSSKGVGLAVYNRLLRAASFNIIQL